MCESWMVTRSGLPWAGSFFFWFLDIVIGRHSLYFLAGSAFIFSFWVYFRNQLYLSTVML